MFVLLLCVPALALGAFFSFFAGLDQKLFPSESRQAAEYSALIRLHESELIAACPGDDTDGVLSVRSSHGATVFVMHTFFRSAPSGFYYSPQDVPLPVFLPENASITAVENGWLFESYSPYHTERCLTRRLQPCWFTFEQSTVER